MQFARIACQFIFRLAGGFKPECGTGSKDRCTQVETRGLGLRTALIGSFNESPASSSEFLALLPVKIAGCAGGKYVPQSVLIPTVALNIIKSNCSLSYYPRGLIRDLAFRLR